MLKLKQVPRVLCAVMLFTFFAAAAFAANLWQDNFNDSKMNPAYETPNAGGGKGPPKWAEESGVLKQIEPVPGDPTYCLVELPQDIDFCGQLVRIRFDEWVDHDRSRAGVGFWNDTNNHQAYTTVIHNSLKAGNYQFLNDALAWHATIIPFDTGGVGAWFWMRAEINAKTKKLVGKVWTGELKDEPKSWMNEVDYTSFGAARNPTRWVGLNGGAGNAEGGFSKISFDDWYVYDEKGINLSVDSQNKITSTWGNLKQ